ncbi:MAG: alkaline phosphatase family protein [Candidatus Jordarchaeaceae archaeon]
MKRKEVSEIKLIYVVIDGMGDLPTEEFGNQTPLEAADTPNLDLLVKRGKAGIMYTVGKGIAPESDVAVISILGYDPFKYSTGRGVIEAIGSDMKFKDGDLALRCNFATMGYKKEIIDRRAGRDLLTEEARELSKTINRVIKLESYPADFEFKSTIGHRAVLVIRSRNKPLSSNISNTDPAYSKVEGLGVAKANVEMVLKKCIPLDETEEANIAAKLVNEFTEKSHKVLEEDKINKKREAQGKLKANLILVRDAGHLLPKFYNINEKYGVRFVSLTDMPVERGISKLAGMETTVLPPPSGNLEEDSKLRVKKLLELLPSYDCFYIHIKGPDEPGHDGDFKHKAELLTIIDKHFFGELLENISLEDTIICVTADHSTPCKLKNHSDDPVPVLISGNKIKADKVQKFSERECRKGSLGILEHGTELMPKLMSFFKK